MDKERAKFVLRSFRPDGADSLDHDFAEALQLATSDRELGEWLMRERAFDAEFAEALARVNLPEGLRESVLLAMVQDGGGFAKPDIGLEGEMITAVAGIEIPAGLRAQIIEAMERTVKIERPVFGWKRFGIPLAAAAGIALAFVFVKNGDPGRIAKGETRIPIDAVQVGFMNAFESPLFSFDRMDADAPLLMSYLHNKGLPCGAGFLPPGLVGLDGVGCRELIIDGKRGSLLCFDDKNGTVHLVIFKRDDVEGELPEITNPEIGQSGDWAKACWEKDGYVFTLMGVRNKSTLGEFF
jgi:hypothetical protein